MTVILLIAAAAALYMLICWFLFRLMSVRRDPSKPDPGLDAVEAEVRPYREAAKAGADWFRAQPVQPVELRSHDGLLLRGQYLPHPQARGAILLMHGYRSTAMHDLCGMLPFYHSLGYALLLPDQRACGESEGKYIGFGALERRDCRLWLDWLGAQVGGDLFLGGVSMGATTVLLTAAQPGLPTRVRGVIADCGFTSCRDICLHVGRAFYRLPATPFLPGVGLLTRLIAGFAPDEANTEREMPHIPVPVLLLHGEADTFVPPEMSRRNLAAAAGRAALVLTPGAGHGLSAMVDPPRYRTAVQAFIEEHRSK